MIPDMRGLGVIFAFGMFGMGVAFGGCLWLAIHLVRAVLFYNGVL